MAPSLSKPRSFSAGLKRIREVGPRRLLSESTAVARAKRAVRTSGLFDETWYRSQVPGGLSADRDALEHYVREGMSQHLSPNPLFSPRHYVSQVPAAARSVVGPFVHYLNIGASKGRAPHPLFDVEYYLNKVPGANDHRSGALGHFLEAGWHEGLEINAWFKSGSYQESHPEAGVFEPAVVHFIRRAAARLAVVPDHRSFPRQYADFDHVGASRFVSDVAVETRDIEPPLVTVVMPARDRADTIGAAIVSVLAQSYPAVELLVVDDGSVDGTRDVVTSFDDERVHLITQPASGVCRARNRALEAAQGDYVAYLDADNRWEPRFLEVMVAFMSTTAHDVAYSALEIARDKSTVYRGAPLERSALLEANYIDINTVVHASGLAERIGGWDESLRRTNDWDFIIRLTATGKVGYAPFIGVHYDHDRERGDRITVREPFGFKFKVYAKHHFDWEQIAQNSVSPGRMSIIVPVTRSEPRLAACLAALAATTEDQDVEILVVDNTPEDGDAIRTLWLADLYPQVTYLRPTWMTLHLPIALAYGVAAATGDLFVIVDPSVAVQPGWLAPLSAPIRAGEADVAQGPLIGWNGTAASTGYFFAADGLPSPALVGFPEHGMELATAGDRQGLTHALLAVTRAELILAEGFDPLFRVGLFDADLTLRIAERTGRPARYVPGPGGVVLGLDPELDPLVFEPDPSTVEQDQQVFVERWAGRILSDEARVLRAFGLRVSHRRPSTSQWASTDAHQPIVQRITGHQRPLRWAIKIAASTVGVRPRWGDWHFALAIRDVLRGLGHEAVVDLKNAWYRPTAHLDDVVLVLRGNARYRPNPDQLNLVWVISHPDMPSDDELARYDYRFAASELYARKLQSRLGLPTDTLLQCTDANRFKPGPFNPDSEQVLFVGNSRGATRPIVADALAAELPIGVYGAHWRGKIPKAVRRAELVPNEELPAMYRSAGVVLNDHWEDMRREAILSNRLFDLAASGATIVSDHVAGIEEVFGSTVRTYDSPDELAAVVADALRHKDEEAAARMELSEKIRKEHSFEARGREIDRVASELISERSRPDLAGPRVG